MDLTFEKVANFKNTYSIMALKRLSDSVRIKMKLIEAFSMAKKLLSGLSLFELERLHPNSVISTSTLAQKIN